jgi:dUTPase
MTVNYCSIIHLNVMLNSCNLFTAGVCDRDFAGSIGVVMFNMSHLPYGVTRGDRIAQVIFEKNYDGLVREVENKVR